MQAYLGIGSNLGDRKSWCTQAISRLVENPSIACLAQSSMYETEPVDAFDQGWFINCVVSIETQLTLQGLFLFCMEIERELGRVRARKNEARIIDIDVLFYGNEISNTPELVLPHPNIETRGFVLIPLAEIAPTFFHPVLHRTIQELCDRLRVSPQARQYMVKRVD